MPKQITCGVVFVDTLKQKILMVHPTNQKDFWDFPKGRRELEETSQEAAIREVKEETSICINEDDKLIDFGEHPYNKHKRIHLFVCYNKKIDFNLLECTSIVDKEYTSYPEVDDFKMFSIEEAVGLMCPSMKTVFVWELEQRIRQHF